MPPNGDVGPGEPERDRYVGSIDLTEWRSRPGRKLADVVHVTSDRLGARPTLILILVIGIVLATFFAWLASEVYEAVLSRTDVAVLDRPLLDAAMQLRTPGIDAAVTAFTNGAGTIGMPIVAVLFLVGFTLQRQTWTPLVLLVCASAGSLLMTIGGKQLIGRARPPLSDAVPPYEHSPSFPSGHTLNATVVLGTIAYLLVLRQSRVATRATTIVVATVLVVAVGASRVFLGHHWFTDVLAAWVLGLAWLSVVITAHRLFLTVVNRRNAAASG